MKDGWRQSAAALGALALVGAAAAGAASEAFSLSAQRAEAAALGEQVAALRAREKRIAPQAAQAKLVGPTFVAKTITLAGAALQERVEAAAAAAKGRLVSSKVDVATHAAEGQVAISAELTLPEPAVQALLFDLETGRPYVFVDGFEARAPEGEGENLHVSLNLSGRWSAEK